MHPRGHCHVQRRTGKHKPSQDANAAAGQQYGQSQGQAAFGNTAQGQGFAQGQSNAGLFNQGSQANFQNQAYNQQLPINEFTALMGNNQVQGPAAAQLSSTGVAPTDVLGAYGLQQQQLNSNYQAQNANYQSGLNGLFNLGGSALMAFSDVRLKEDIHPVGEYHGHNVYDFQSGSVGAQWPDRCGWNARTLHLRRATWRARL